MNSRPTSPAGSSRRNPPALVSDGRPAAPWYQGRDGSHSVSSSSLVGFSVVRWMTLMSKNVPCAGRRDAAAPHSLPLHAERPRRRVTINGYIRFVPCRLSGKLRAAWKLCTRRKLGARSARFIYIGHFIYLQNRIYRLKLVADMVKCRE